MRTPHLSLALTPSILALALGLAHCSSSPTPCYQDATCIAAVEAGADGGSDGGPVVGPPPGCDPLADAKDAPACAVDEYAVFVDGTSGNDTGAGTKASPVRSITTALTKLAGRPRVYICEGEYNERVTITSAVSLYGGFACGSWNYTGTKSKIRPTIRGYALEVSGAKGAKVADVDVSVANADEPGESSIAAFVSNSTIELTRVTILAGRGSAGLTATQKKRLDAPMAGSQAVNPDGGPGVTNECGEIDSVGGNGGAVGLDDATVGTPNRGGGQAGRIGSGTDCSANGGVGVAGGHGAPGKPADGQLLLGVLSEDGWLPSSGVKGASGQVGQGGGGGGSNQGAGGGGGAGGCGGEGGDGGGGGGASIALLVYASDVNLRGPSSLTTVDAGDGGAGALGQLGQPFGVGGFPGPGATTPGCGGGRGGNGGNGGAGGGGAGGLSVAVLFSGRAPRVDATVDFVTGKAGGAGSGLSENSGPPGKKENLLQLE